MAIKDTLTTVTDGFKTKLDDEMRQRFEIYFNLLGNQVAERLGHTGDLGSRKHLDRHRHLAITARDGDANPGLPYVQRERNHSDFLDS